MILLSLFRDKMSSIQDTMNQIQAIIEEKLLPHAKDPSQYQIAEILLSRVEAMINTERVCGGNVLLCDTCRSRCDLLRLRLAVARYSQ
jgi:hypothetical protein